MKLLSIVGARPQFIKLSPLCRAIERWNSSAPSEQIESVIVHTGQHYDDEMSKVFFDQMQIPEPSYNLGVGSGSHASQTGGMIERLEPVLVKEHPDAVVVFGDTNSTLAGAITASKMHMPVAHVEAGLRSYNRTMPEEVNRVLVDHVSALLFCPTERAVSNLAKEGFTTILPAEGQKEVLRTVSASSAVLVRSGDIMYDSFLFNAAVAEKTSGVLAQLGLKSKGYALLTIHRAENTKDRNALDRILSFLQRYAGERTIVFPVHPRTKNFILENNMKVPAHFLMIPPVSYFDMIMLEKHAADIFTDSGGVQKEAFFARVPCVTLRTETEWPETVESGWNRMMNEMTEAPGPLPPYDGKRYFGDGNSADLHLRVLVDFCQMHKSVQGFAR